MSAKRGDVLGEGSAVVYAIVVNYNGWQDTLECLESLLRSDYEALRVIVCDNASADDSVEKIVAWARGDVPAPTPSDPRLASLVRPPIREPFSVVVRSDSELTRDDGSETMTSGQLMLVRCHANLGFAGANNVGLRWVLQREPNAYALLLNNDAVIAPDAIRGMVAQAERSPRAGAIGATLLQYHRPDKVEMFAGARFNRLHGMVELIGADAERVASRPPAESLPMDYVAGCCLLVSRSTIERVGLMDESYFLYGEDADWCLRMRRQNLRMAYCPSAEIWHKGGGSVVHGSALHDYYAVRGTLMVLHRHFPLTLPLALPYAVLRFLLPKLLRGEWRRLRAATRGYRDFVRYALGRSRADLQRVSGIDVIPSRLRTP